MEYKYRGTFVDIQKTIFKAGYCIEKIRPLPYKPPGIYEFKIFCVGNIIWNERIGTITFEGNAYAVKKLQEDLAPYLEEIPTTPSPKIASNVPQTPSQKIFIVHGHDHVALEQVKLVLYDLGLAPYILPINNGLTLIEALEKEICNDSIGFGIVLLTPDDMGYVKTASAETARPRARQNVILEMGMLMSALTRKNVAILRKKDIEIPSDAQGIIYIPFNDHVKETVPQLADRLMEAGFTIDPKKLALASR
ncbi:TIR domain-containing protein [Bartonella raoultii]|uniref:TIR domain-containing protein n=1 Tax=Bartonella raoultii TaxID=1457020 RepID=UPI001ABB4864|nr:nucleotide-binding protein [Bartonella raoultii]